jgi:hypothetical protein
VVVGKAGGHGIAAETRQLIREMARANFLWGAPCIHGELLKPGIIISRAIVSRYMPVCTEASEAEMRTFLRGHAAAIVRSRTLEGHHWADDLRSWSHVVKYRAVAALAGSPCWRAWYLAGACRLDAAHRRVWVAQTRH